MGREPTTVPPFYLSILFLVISLSIVSSKPYEVQYEWKDGTTLSSPISLSLYPTTPGARARHSVTYDAASPGGYVFGGLLQTDPFIKGKVMGDIWKFNVTSNLWTIQSTEIQSPNSVTVGTQTPGPRVGAFIWKEGNILLLYGGQPEIESPNEEVVLGEPLNDLWRFNTQYWTLIQKDIPGPDGIYPKPRVDCAMYNEFISSSSKSIYMFGGYADAGKTQKLAELWRGFADSTQVARQWTRVWKSNKTEAVYSGNINEIQPEVTDFPTMWVHSGNQMVYVFGGVSKNASAAAEMWGFNLNTKVWTLLSSRNRIRVSSGAAATHSPGMRHSMTSWVASTFLFLSGGVHPSGTVYTDTWRFSVGVSSLGNWENRVAGGSYSVDLSLPFVNYTSTNAGCYGPTCFAYGSLYPSSETFSASTAVKLGTAQANWDTPVSATSFVVYPPSIIFGSHASFVSRPPSLFNSGLAIMGGALYLVFGETTTGKENKVWRYDETEKIWSSYGNLPYSQDKPMMWNNDTHLWIFGDSNYGALLVVIEIAQMFVRIVGNKPIDYYDPDNAWPGGRTLGQGYFNGTHYLLYGGLGHSEESFGLLCDLWAFNIETEKWTFMAGYTTADSLSDPTFPGGRSGGHATGGDGNFYLFTNLNETYVSLWSWNNPSDSWKGYFSSIEVNYPNLGETSELASPGFRDGGAIGYYKGSVFLYGGATTDGKIRNDVWAFIAQPKEGYELHKWYWISGSVTDTFSTPAVRKTTFGQNIPAGRTNMASVFSGNRVWFYGGVGIPDSLHPTVEHPMADLWAMDLKEVFVTNTTATFEYLTGTNWIIPTLYPVGQGELNASPFLGSRAYSSWALFPSSGDAYLYGGYGYIQNNAVDVTSIQSDAAIVMGDMWKFNIKTQNWTWVNGYINSALSYPPKGSTSPTANPGPRHSSCMWTHNENIWLYGGIDTDGVPHDDMWYFNIAQNAWYWVGGTNQTDVTSPELSPGFLVGISCASWNGLFIVFGGAYPGTLYGSSSVWTYDPEENLWGLLNPVTTDSPGPRYQAALWVVDNDIYVYGGATSEVRSMDMYSDLWQFSITSLTWTRISDGGPTSYPGEGFCGFSPGARKGMTTWAYNNQLYISSGYEIYFSVQIRDVWAFDLTWSQWCFKHNTTNSVTFMMANTFDESEGTLHAYGGLDGVSLTNSYNIYHATNDTWTRHSYGGGLSKFPIYPMKGSSHDLSPTPGATAAGGLFFYPGSSDLVLVGGNFLQPNTLTAQNTANKPVWHYTQDTGTWEDQGSIIDNNGQPFRTITGSCSRAIDGFVYIFGGSDESKGLTNKLIRWQINSSRFEDLGGDFNDLGNYTDLGNGLRPPSRAMPLCWATETDFWIYGGVLTTYLPNDMWRYNVIELKWHLVINSTAQNAISTPTRLGARTGSLVAGNSTHVWILGGAAPGGSKYALDDSSHDFWEYNILTASWTMLNEGLPSYPSSHNQGGPNFFPGSRTLSDMILFYNRIFVFGATASGANDLWEYNIETRMWFWIEGVKETYAPRPGELTMPAGRLMYQILPSSDGFYIRGGIGKSPVTKYATTNQIPDVPFEDMWYIKLSGIPGLPLPPSTTTGAISTTGSTTDPATITTATGESSSSSTSATSDSTTSGSSTSDESTTTTTGATIALPTTGESTSTSESTTSTGESTTTTTDESTTTSTTDATTSGSTSSSSTSESTTTTAEATISTTSETNATSTTSTTSTTSESTTSDSTTSASTTTSGSTTSNSTTSGSITSGSTTTDSTTTDSTTTSTSATTSTSETTTTTSSTDSTTSVSSSSTGSGVSTTGVIPICGNGIQEPGEACDSNLPCCNQTTCTFKPSTVECRGSRGLCDVADYCSGSRETCPDVTRSQGYVCSLGTGDCAVPMVCGDSVSDCPPEKVLHRDLCNICGGDNSTCTTAGVCGDGVCNNATETCSNCVLDCRRCSVEAKCENNCNNRGVCDNGKCICQDSWSGAACETTIVIDVVTKPNGTDTEIIVDSKIIFSLQLLSITELNSGNDVVISYPLNTQNISGSISSESGVQKSTYTINIENSATVLLHFTMAGNESVSIPFGSNIIILQPHSVKLSIEIVNWPFASIRNLLQITMAVNSATYDECNTYTSSVDQSGNLRWIELSVDGLMLYGSFLDYALVDQQERPMLVSPLYSGSVVAFTLPHFWVHAVIDPDFSVVLGKNSEEKDGCGQAIQGDGKNSSNKAAIIAGSVVGGVALVAIVSGSIFMHKKKLAIHKKLSNRRSVEMKGSSSSMASPSSSSPLYVSNERENPMHASL